LLDDNVTIFVLDGEHGIGDHIQLVVIQVLEETANTQVDTGVLEWDI
jgi:hypothetical protein